MLSCQLTLLNDDEIQVTVRSQLPADLVTGGVLVGAVRGVPLDRADDVRQRLDDDAGVMPAVALAAFADQHQAAGRDLRRLDLLAAAEALLVLRRRCRR